MTYILYFILAYYLTLTVTHGAYSISNTTIYKFINNFIFSFYSQTHDNICMCLSHSFYVALDEIL